MSSSPISCQELPFAVGDVVYRISHFRRYVVVGIEPTRLRKVGEGGLYTYPVDPSDWVHAEDRLYENPRNSRTLISLGDAVDLAKEMLRAGETDTVKISRVRATVTQSVNYDLKG